VLYVRNFVEIFVVVLWLLALGRVLVGWVDPQVRSPVSRYVVAWTEPMLAPIRRLLPQTGMLDWSPFILMVGLGLLWRFVSL
jgi:YggT family protein